MPKRSRFSPAIIVGAIAAAVGLSGTALAITSTSFVYSAAKTGYFSIDAMSMSPDSADSASDFLIEWTGSLTTGSTGCYNTGVHLPNGATARSVTMWYSSSAGSDPTVLLLRRRFSDGHSDNLVDGTGVSDTHVRKAVKINIADAMSKVNNLGYSYGFGVCLKNGDAFLGARIEYTFNNAGD